MAVATTVTAKVWDAPFPQALDGTTSIVPDEEPEVTVTELELPPPVWFHPTGKDQV